MASPEGAIEIEATPFSRLRLILRFLTLVLLIGLAALLRFHALASKSVWIDEGVSIEMARLDTYNFLRILWRHEGNMALYTVLLRLWILFGHTEAYIRSLSVVAGVATVPALYLLGRQMFNAHLGLIAAFLLAINTYHIRYSQEARSYSLYPLLVVLSSLYWVRFLQHPSRADRIAHVVTSALGVYAHFFALFVPLSQWLSLRMWGRGEAALKAAKNWRWFLLAIAPVILFILTTGTGVIRWIPRPTLAELATTAQFLTGHGDLALALAYLGACLGALVPTGRRQASFGDVDWRYRYLVVWIVGPIALVFLVSQLKPIFLARYFIFVVPALALLAAGGLARIRSRTLLGAALMLFALLSLPATRTYYQKDFDIAREDWRMMTRYLAAHSNQGDVVIFHQPIGRMPYEYYRSLIPSAYYPTVIYPAHGERLSFRDFYAGHAPEEWLKNLPGRFQRVWVVLTYNQLPSGPDASTRLIQDVFGQHYDLQRQLFAGIELRLYSRAQPGRGMN